MRKAGCASLSRPTRPYGPGLTGNSEEEIEAFYEKQEKYEKKP